jgi:hypothetical protein
MMDFEIVQVVQEISNAGGVETVASELARVFTRYGLSNVVLASAIGADVDTAIKVERVAPWLSRIRTRGLLRYVGRTIVVSAFTSPWPVMV